MIFIAPKWIVDIAGRWYFSVSKRFPDFFLVFPAMGVAVGVCFIFFIPDDYHLSPRAMAIVGVVFLLFYSALIVMNLVKRWRGTWDEFCDWAHAIFED